MTHFYIFGDSITQGAWDNFGGWVQRIRRVLDEHFVSRDIPRFLTVNIGGTGHTSVRLLDVFEKEMSIQPEVSSETLILFSIGLSDSRIHRESGQCEVPLETFKQNIIQLGVKAAQYTQHYAFVGLTPIVEAEVNPLPWDKAHCYDLQTVQSYNKALQETCAAHDMGFVDVWQDWQEEDYADWLFDGLHPNAIGHQKIARRVLHDFLTPKGWSVAPQEQGGYITAE